MRNRVRMKYSMTSSMSIVSMKQSESESTNRIVNDATTTTSSPIWDDNDHLDEISIVVPSDTSGRQGQRDPDVIIGGRENI